LADSREAPLAGKRIVVTRAVEQSGELVRALESRGAQVVLFPMIRFAPPEDWGPVDRALSRRNDFSAVLFLSANAVRYVFERCRHLAVKFAPGDAPGPFIAAVGPATAQAIIDEGSRADYVGRDRTGELLVRELRPQLENRAVLLPRSDRRDAALSLALRDAGVRVTEIVAYRTMMPEARDEQLAEQIRHAEVDVIVFASPSAVRNFAVIVGADHVKKISKRVQFAAIGRTTAKALRDARLPVAIEAEESSAKGLADAIARFYEMHAQTMRHSQ
jgi:uroporphyrinogen III methyltransferase/synthase